MAHTVTEEPDRRVPAMTIALPRASTAAVSSPLLGATALHAVEFHVSDYTPLTPSAGRTTDVAQPVAVSSSEFSQKSIAARQDQLAAGVPNTGSFDMITLNENGPHQGRYLFTVFETGQSGVQRHDLHTGQTDTVWHAITAGSH